MRCNSSSFQRFHASQQLTTSGDAVLLAERTETGSDISERVVRHRADARLGRASGALQTMVPDRR